MSYTSKTSGKTSKKLFIGAADGKPFSKQNQPTPEQKKRGWDKRKALKDLLELTTSGRFGKSKTDYRKIAANYLGIKEEDVTIKTIMEFKQIQKAITKADTYAFSVLMDRAYGKPKQDLGLTDKNGNDRNLIDLSKLSDDELRAIVKG